MPTLAAVVGFPIRLLVLMCLRWPAFMDALEKEQQRRTDAWLREVFGPDAVS
ncbi:hypothetical protein HMPREF9946_02208 [Acetobacteraceae bacterium AT-5844]|nr:hypothetical protein HMPREF9946_02208 [Acetobacteraceae bacterium AT-5844]